MFIVDFHTHCFPDAIAGRALEFLSNKASIPFFHNGTATGLDSFERAGGCDGYVVLPIATKPEQTFSVNSFAGKIHCPDRFVFAFGSVHPANDDFKEQLGVIKSLGLRGVKMHPEYQSFHVNDERLFPVYEEIFRLGLPIIFHAGEDDGFQHPWHSEPCKIAEVAARFPEGVIIAAHLGGYKMWHEAAECLPSFPNVYIDVSFCAGRMPLDEFIEICGMWRCDRILFGTDSPWHCIEDSVFAVEQLPCSLQEKELIFSGNALRILN